MDHALGRYLSKNLAGYLVPVNVRCRRGSRERRLARDGNSRTGSANSARTTDAAVGLWMYSARPL